MSYRTKVICGFSWSFFVRVCAMALVTLKIWITARLLTPDAFGLFALVVILLGISEAVTETGVNITILQAKESVKYFLSTAWVIAIVRGFIIGCLMILMAAGSSAFFRLPELLWLGTLCAVVPVIKGFINPAIVTFHKEMLFWKDSMYRISLLTCEVILASLFALLLGNVQALIWALIGTALFEVVLSFMLFSDWPTFTYIPSRAQRIFSNSKGLTLSAILSYLVENADDFILGKMLGTYHLGVYHNSYSLSHKVTFELAKSVHHGTLPALSAISYDQDRLNRAWWRSMLALILILSCTSIPFVLFPSLIVSLVLGSSWTAVIPILPYLTLAGVVQSVGLICYTYFYSKKEYFFLNAHLLVTVLCMVPGLWWGASTAGLLGAVQGLLVARLIAAPIALLGVWSTRSK